LFCGDLRDSFTAAFFDYHMLLYVETPTCTFTMQITFVFYLVLQAQVEECTLQMKEPNKKRVHLEMQTVKKNTHSTDSLLKFTFLLSNKLRKSKTNISPTSGACRGLYSSLAVNRPGSRVRSSAIPTRFLSVTRLRCGYADIDGIEEDGIHLARQRFGGAHTSAT